MSLLQEVIQLMNKNWCDNKSIEDLIYRSEEELNMIKCAYEPKQLKASYPEPVKKLGAGYNIPRKIKTQEEFIEITNNLEKQWILNEDYDNYYSPWCTITVQWNRYYTN